jgi:hypothetical protein
VKSILLLRSIRRATVMRSVGDEHEPGAFSVFAPMVIAGIGKQAETVEDRSIIIELKRKKPNERTESFRTDRAGEADVFARKSARWAKDNSSSLATADPLVPRRTTGGPYLPLPMRSAADGQSRRARLRQGTGLRRTRWPGGSRASEYIPDRSALMIRTTAAIALNSSPMRLNAICPLIPFQPLHRYKRANNDLHEKTTATLAATPTDTPAPAEAIPAPIEAEA